MIQLSGLSLRNARNPDGDIAIVEIGLRPGEKLFEELLIGADAQRTAHPRIMKAREQFMPADELHGLVQGLEAARSDAECLGLLAKLVPELEHRRDERGGARAAGNRAASLDWQGRVIQRLAMQKSGHGKLGWLKSGRVGLYVAAGFLVLVFLTGGSSRGDAVQLLVLRPLAMVFGAWALTRIDWPALRAGGAPLWLLSSMIALALVQLVPLPPALWETLPWRDLVREIEQTMGMEPGWRALSLSPSGTSNALAALLVPMVALLLYVGLGKDDRRRLWLVILGLGLLSAVLGIVQISGDPRGPAYLYRVTNPGVAVGLLANRNHQGVYLGIMLLVAGWYISTIERGSARAGLRSVLAAGSMIVIAPMVLLAFSRAGLGAAVLGLIGAGWFLMRAPLIPRRIRLGGRFGVPGRSAVGAMLGLMALVIGLSVTFARDTTFIRFVEQDQAEELRFALYPVLERMLADGFPYGMGLGSFEYVYTVYEPAHLLRPEYVNLAHNDWAQWAIEGGLPAVLIALAFALWFVRSVLVVLREGDTPMRDRKLMAAGVIALLLAASIVDYPLRTPALGVLFTIACLTLAEPAQTAGFAKSRSAARTGI